MDSRGGDRVGLQKKYGSAKALYEGVKSYFDSITRRDLVTEQEDTGELDRYGHKIFIPVPAKNGNGEEIYRTVYLIPPSVGDLCDHLQIHLSTWRRYCAEEKFREVTEWANDRFVNWRFSEAVVRPDKMTKGLIYDLEANYRAKSADLQREEQQAEEIRRGMKAIADLMTSPSRSRDLQEFEEEQE